MEEEFDLASVLRAVKSKDETLVAKLRGSLHNKVNQFLGKLPVEVEDAVKVYERGGNWDDGKLLLLSLIEHKVDPKRIDTRLIEKALRIGTQETKEIIERVGQKIACEVFMRCLELSGTDPNIVVKFGRGNPRIGLNSDRLAIGIELLFNRDVMHPHRWRQVSKEFDEVLTAVPLSGGTPWLGVRVSNSKEVEGYCVLQAWHRMNLPIFCVICREFFRNEAMKASVSDKN